MRKILTLVFTLLIAGSLSFAQTGGGTTGSGKAPQKKTADADKGGKKGDDDKGGKKGHKGGKKGKKGSSGTTTPPPK